VQRRVIGQAEIVAKPDDAWAGGCDDHRGRLTRKMPLGSFRPNDHHVLLFNVNRPVRSSAGHPGRSGGRHRSMAPCSRVDTRARHHQLARAKSLATRLLWNQKGTREASLFALIVSGGRYFGCGTMRIYGFGAFQPCG
jgi:hypothetical protein